MKKGDGRSLNNDRGQLRGDAEQKVTENVEKKKKGAAEVSVMALLHELQVHRVELAMQNDELRQARETLEEIMERYEDFYDFAPVGYLSLDADGVIRGANLAAASILGAQRAMLLNCHLDIFLNWDSRPLFREFLHRVFTEKMKAGCDLMLARPEQTVVFRIEGIVSRGGGGMQGRHDGHQFGNEAPAGPAARQGGAGGASGAADPRTGPRDR